MIKIAPRDIFNEANFLKNIALLVESIEDGSVPNIGFSKIDLDHPDLFSIDESSGDWVLKHGTFFNLSTYEPLHIKRGLNARDPFPIFIETDDYEVYDIFDNDGSIHIDFIKFLGEPDQRSLQNGMSQPIFSRANFIKNVARLAMDSIPGVGKQLMGLLFDENDYTDNGLIIHHDEEYLYLFNDYFTRDGVPLTLRSASDKNRTNEWSLEVSMDGELFERVFTDLGEYDPIFLREPHPTLHVNENEHTPTISRKR